MTVTLQDTQKFRGVGISGRPVISHCNPAGWRARVQQFLGRELPPDTPKTRSTGVLISWLRENFGRCPANADEETITFYCRAWIMHLFGCVLFPDGTGDTASWMYLPCLTDWHMAGGYSWGSAILGYLYRQLCQGCRRTSPNSTLGGCVYLLQLWMWSRLPVGRPILEECREWFDEPGLRRRPTYAYLWDQDKGPFARTKGAYIDYANELDQLTPGVVTWEPYHKDGSDDSDGSDDEQQDADIVFSVMCRMDEDLYLMRCPLICFYAVEWHMPHRVACQFGLRQQWPVEPFSTSIELHKIDRQKQKETDFETLHRDYIDQWDNQQDNLYDNNEPHTQKNFRAYLNWYRRATRTKLKVQWTQADYADIQSSEDEETSYDVATRAGTQVEAAPILDRVGNALMQSVADIERFPRIGVDEEKLEVFLDWLARRLRRAATCCGCGTSMEVDVQRPQTAGWEPWPNTSHGGSGEQSSSQETIATIQGNGDEDGEEEDEDAGGYDQLDSELEDAPSTQATQDTRRR